MIENGMDYIVDGHSHSKFMATHLNGLPPHRGKTQIYIYILQVETEASQQYCIGANLW